MTPEEKALLDNVHRMVKENNNILRSMQRRGRISFSLRIVYWVLIIGISLGAFYFIQPYIEMLRSVTSGDTSSPNKNYIQQIEELVQ